MNLLNKYTKIKSDFLVSPMDEEILKELIDFLLEKIITIDNSNTTDKIIEESFNDIQNKYGLDGLKVLAFVGCINLISDLVMIHSIANEAVKDVIKNRKIN
jgi:hypothetical protein